MGAGHDGRNRVFSEVTIKDLIGEGKLAKWEDNGEKLSKLIQVIKMIVEVVRTAARNKCALVIRETMS